MSRSDVQGAIELHHSAVQRHRDGDFAAALELIRKAITIAPSEMRLHYHEAVLLDAMKQLSESHAALRRAADCASDDVDLLIEVARGLHYTGQAGRALELSERLVALRPQDAAAHWNHAILLLLHGRFEEGWREFEWRHRMGTAAAAARQWNGAPLNGKTLLVRSEGGFGDVLFFSRWLRRLGSKGGRIFLHCQPELFDLFSPIAGLTECLPRDAALPQFDVQVFLSSLPLVLGEMIPTAELARPWLVAPVERIEEWRRRIPQGTKRKIGLVWSGHHANPQADPRRIPPAMLARLGNVPGVEYFSLQVGARERPSGLELVDLTAHIRDFADTSALISLLDGVVSVDTSVAHLTSAMGKPLYLLMNYVPAYQWLLDRTDSPWYPTTRIFRQRALYDWEAPIAELAEFLRTP